VSGAPKATPRPIRSRPYARSERWTLLMAVAVVFAAAGFVVLSLWRMTHAG
jgi:hypothetical protein